MPKCKACDAEIRFTKTSQGKWQPLNPDGSNHMKICRYPELFETNDLLGIVTLEETDEGWSFAVRNKAQGLLGQGQFKDIEECVRWSLGLLEA